VQTEIGQIARGAGLGLGANAVNYAVSYLFGILVARQLGADEFGLYTLGVTAVTLMSRFTILGLDRGLMRYASISRGQKKGRDLRHLVGIALVVGAAAGALGGLLLWIFPEATLALLRWSDKSGLLPLLPILAIAAPAMTLTGIAIAGTQAFRTMRYRAVIVNIVQPVVRLVAALALIFIIGPTAMAPVLAFALAQALGTVLALLALAGLVRRVPATHERTPGAAQKLFRFSAPLMFSNVLAYLNGRTEILVLGMFLVAGASGIYNAAGRLAGLGLLVLTAFNAIFAPVISDLHHRGRMTELDTLFKLVTRWTIAFAMPLIVVQLIFAPQLMSLFGPEFVVGAPALRLLTLGQTVNFATGAVGLMLVMSGRSNIVFFNSLFTVILALALDFLLVPRYGLIGAGVAGALMLAIVNMVRVLEVWWLMRIHPFDLGFVKPFLAAAPAALAGLAWLHWLPVHTLYYLAAACVVVGLVYLLATWLLGLNEGDRMLLDALHTRARRLLPAGTP